MTRTTPKFILGLIAAAFASSAAISADVVTDWASLAPPPAPKIEKVSPDIATTALLMLDFNTPPCDPAKRPRCVATIPAAKALLQHARAKGMLVIYTMGGSTSADSINGELKPLGSEPLMSAGPDKFLNTDMEKVLKDHGIKTVITMGTVSNGAILYTASEAAFRGFKVLVPIDGISAETPYGEQITLWQLTSGPRLGGDSIKLTKTEMIDF